MSAPIVFLDTETTGVHPGRQVWEIGMIRRWSDGSQRETSFFVEVDLSGADPFGLSVGRFYERHPLGRQITEGASGTGAYSRADAARKVATWTHGAHIAGAVPNFDTETLAPLLRSEGLIPAWHYHLIDVEALAAGWLNGFSRTQQAAENRNHMRELATPPWKSDDLSAALGVKVSEEERHTALGDAKWAMRIYDAVIGGAS
jgi:3' exoribonuclease, RNase T-like